PATAIRVQWRVKSSSSHSRWSYHCRHPVAFRSCHRAPCHGSSGTRTRYPRSARSRAHGTIDAGDPVNPWQSKTPRAAGRSRGPVSNGPVSNGPVSNGSALYGSAPAIMSAMAASPPSILSCRQHDCIVVRPTGQDSRTRLSRWVVALGSRMGEPDRVKCGASELIVRSRRGDKVFYWFLKFMALGPLLKLL